MLWTGRRFVHRAGRGDGGKPLLRPFVTVSSTRRNVPLTSRTRVRVR
jgi:hypothetical protein